MLLQHPRGMARKTAIARWEASSKAGIRYDPPWEYKSHFYQAVSGLGGRKKSLLDLGTGTGKVIFETRAYESYEGVFGIDIEPGMIDLARKRARQIGVQVSFIQGDNLDLPFPKESFQIVTSMFSPYTPEEAFRVLAPGGHFILLWGLYGDHRELTSLFPEIFSLWKGRLYFETFAEREERLEKAGLHLLGHTTLPYQ